MDSKLVGVAECESYDYDTVRQAVFRAFRLAGITAGAFCGKTVFIKANLVLKMPPEKCATTHPSVVAAIASYVRSAGGHAVIGDSPGGPLGPARIDGIYETTGMKEAARISGAALNRDFGEREVFNADAAVLKRFTLMKAIRDADVVISAAKLKTHCLTGFTGAVKNMFGCVPGLIKAEYHYRMPDLDTFSQMLVDLCNYIRPQISVIDAICGMEKDGPTAGVPKKLNAVIASRDPHAADVAALKLIDCKPESVCTVKRAIENGIIEKDFSDIRIAGDIEKLICKNFIMAQTSDKGLRLLRKYIPRTIHSRMQNWLTPRPVFDKRFCRGCRVCEQSCPPKAIAFRGSIPVVDLEACIRCYCCHELCPYQAVWLKRPWLYKLN
jgi:uncharacterized protein (DUF362 family)/Pyruvate/2-oxoacid:ferredoxin oxidoreductase delta subunit